MQKVNETVQRINSWYVGDDCIQDMIPYKGAITILDKDGIVYHHKEGSEFIINEYIGDERRKQFPYHTIPIHCNKMGGDGKKYFTNQLLDFGQNYISLTCGAIFERCVVKENNEALLLTKIMCATKRSVFKTRKELEKIFKPPLNKSEKLYYLSVDGSIDKCFTFRIDSEEEIVKKIKSYLSKCVVDLENQVNFSDFKKNDLLFDFTKQSINTMNLKNMQLNFPFNFMETIILVKTDGSNITIQGIDVYFVTFDCYKVDIFDIPVTKYTLEQIKDLTPKILKTKEPKIPLRLNPGVSKEDIQKAKQMIKTLKQ